MAYIRTEIFESLKYNLSLAELVHCTIVHCFFFVYFNYLLFIFVTYNRGITFFITNKFFCVMDGSVTKVLLQDEERRKH